MEQELFEYVGVMYKDCAIEINEIAKQKNLSVLPMVIDLDQNIDVDDNRLLVWIDENSCIRYFEVG